jgi:tetratricopeptide (TPR) repeat protein
MKWIAHLLPWASPRLLGSLAVLGLLSVVGGWTLYQRTLEIRGEYHYPYALSETLPLTSVQQELTFYQNRLRQRDSSLERTALAQTYLKLAKATGDTHWYLQAEQAAQISRSQLPFNNAGAILVLARVAEAKHDFQTSIKLAQEVLTAEPQNEAALGLLVTSYLAQGKLDQAERIATQLVEQTPTLGTYTLSALVATARGKDDVAAQHFQTAIAAEEPGEQGSSAYVRIVYGRFLMDRRQLDLARTLLKEAQRIAPQDPAALVTLAKLETRAGNYQRAEALYEQVFQAKGLANIFDHAALAGLAELRGLQGDDEGARDWWNRAEAFLRGHPELKTFGHQRELAQVLLARGNPQDRPEALRLMQAEVKIRRDAQTLNTLAWALTVNGRWQAAQSILQEALDTGVQDASLYDRAAQIADALGQRDRAQQYRVIATRLDPALSPVR